VLDWEYRLKSTGAEKRRIPNESGFHRPPLLSAISLPRRRPRFSATITDFFQGFRFAILAACLA
jgi:hypothetical protein